MVLLKNVRRAEFKRIRRRREWATESITSRYCKSTVIYHYIYYAIWPFLFAILILELLIPNTHTDHVQSRVVDQDYITGVKTFMQMENIVPRPKRRLD